MFFTVRKRYVEFFSEIFTFAWDKHLRIECWLTHAASHSHTGKCTISRATYSHLLHFVSQQATISATIFRELLVMSLDFLTHSSSPTTTLQPARTRNTNDDDRSDDDDVLLPFADVLDVLSDDDHGRDEEKEGEEEEDAIERTIDKKWNPNFHHIKIFTALSAISFKSPYPQFIFVFNWVQFCPIEKTAWINYLFMKPN